MKLPAAYVAGLIDAGGYLQKRQRKTWVAWQLRVTAPTLEVAQLLAQQFDGKVEEIKGGYRVAWYSRAGIASVLEYAKPFLLAINEKVEEFEQSQH